MSRLVALRFFSVSLLFVSQWLFAGSGITSAQPATGTTGCLLLPLATSWGEGGHSLVVQQPPPPAAPLWVSSFGGEELHVAVKWFQSLTPLSDSAVQPLRSGTMVADDNADSCMWTPRVDAGDVPAGHRRVEELPSLEAIELQPRWAAEARTPCESVDFRGAVARRPNLDSLDAFVELRWVCRLARRATDDDRPAVSIATNVTIVLRTRDGRQMRCGRSPASAEAADFTVSPRLVWSVSRLHWFPRDDPVTSNTGAAGPMLFPALMVTLVAPSPLLRLDDAEAAESSLPPTSLRLTVFSGRQVLAECIAFVVESVNQTAGMLNAPCMSNSFTWPLFENASQRVELVVSDLTSGQYLPLRAGSEAAYHNDAALPFGPLGSMGQFGLWSARIASPSLVASNGSLRRELQLRGTGFKFTTPPDWVATIRQNDEATTTAAAVDSVSQCTLLPVTDTEATCELLPASPGTPDPTTAPTCGRGFRQSTWRTAPAALQCPSHPATPVESLRRCLRGIVPPSDGLTLASLTRMLDTSVPASSGDAEDRLVNEGSWLRSPSLALGRFTSSSDTNTITSALSLHWMSTSFRLNAAYVALAMRTAANQNTSLPEGAAFWSGQRVRMLSVPFGDATVVDAAVPSFFELVADRFETDVAFVCDMDMVVTPNLTASATTVIALTELSGRVATSGSTREVKESAWSVLCVDNGGAEAGVTVSQLMGNESSLNASRVVWLPMEEALRSEYRLSSLTAAPIDAAGSAQLRHRLGIRLRRRVRTARVVVGGSLNATEGIAIGISPVPSTRPIFNGIGTEAGYDVPAVDPVIFNTVEALDTLRNATLLQMELWPMMMPISRPPSRPPRTMTTASTQFMRVTLLASPNATSIRGWPFRVAPWHGCSWLRLAAAWRGKASNSTNASATGVDRVLSRCNDTDAQSILDVIHAFSSLPATGNATVDVGMRALTWRPVLSESTNRSGGCPNDEPRDYPLTESVPTLVGDLLRAVGAAQQDLASYLPRQQRPVNCVDRMVRGAAPTMRLRSPQMCHWGGNDDVLLANITIACRCSGTFRLDEGTTQWIVGDSNDASASLRVLSSEAATTTLTWTVSDGVDDRGSFARGYDPSFSRGVTGVNEVAPSCDGTTPLTWVIDAYKSYGASMAATVEVLSRESRGAVWGPETQLAEDAFGTLDALTAGLPVGIANYGAPSPGSGNSTVRPRLPLSNAFLVAPIESFSAPLTDDPEGIPTGEWTFDVLPADAFLAPANVGGSWDLWAALTSSVASVAPFYAGPLASECVRRSRTATTPAAYAVTITIVSVDVTPDTLAQPQDVCFVVIAKLFVDGLIPDDDLRRIVSETFVPRVTLLKEPADVAGTSCHLIDSNVTVYDSSYASRNGTSGSDGTYVRVGFGCCLDVTPMPTAIGFSTSLPCGRYRVRLDTTAAATASDRNLLVFHTEPIVTRRPFVISDNIAHTLAFEGARADPVSSPVASDTAQVGPRVLTDYTAAAASGILPSAQQALRSARPALVVGSTALSSTATYEAPPVLLMSIADSAAALPTSWRFQLFGNDFPPSTPFVGSRARVLQEQDARLIVGDTVTYGWDLTTMPSVRVAAVVYTVLNVSVSTWTYNTTTTANANGTLANVSTSAADRTNATLTPGGVPIANRSSFALRSLRHVAQRIACAVDVLDASSIAAECPASELMTPLTAAWVNQSTNNDTVSSLADLIVLFSDSDGSIGAQPARVNVSTSVPSEGMLQVTTVNTTIRSARIQLEVIVELEGTHLYNRTITVQSTVGTTSATADPQGGLDSFNLNDARGVMGWLQSAWRQAHPTVNRTGSSNNNGSRKLQLLSVSASSPFAPLSARMLVPAGSEAARTLFADTSAALPMLCITSASRSSAASTADVEDGSTARVLTTNVSWAARREASLAPLFRWTPTATSWSVAGQSTPCDACWPVEWEVPGRAASSKAGYLDISEPTRAPPAADVWTTSDVVVTCLTSDAYAPMRDETNATDVRNWPWPDLLEQAPLSSFAFPGALAQQQVLSVRLVIASPFQASVVDATTTSTAELVLPRLANVALGGMSPNGTDGVAELLPTGGQQLMLTMQTSAPSPPANVTAILPALAGSVFAVAPSFSAEAPICRGTIAAGGGLTSTTVCPVASQANRRQSVVKSVYVANPRSIDRGAVVRAGWDPLLACMTTQVNESATREWTSIADTVDEAADGWRRCLLLSTRARPFPLVCPAANQTHSAWVGARDDDAWSDCSTNIPLLEQPSATGSEDDVPWSPSALPVILSVSPRHGQRGTVLTITGQRFPGGLLGVASWRGAVHIAIGDGDGAARCDLREATTTSLQCVIATVGVHGPKQLYVRTAAGDVATADLFAATFFLDLYVSSVSQGLGGLGGGFVVRIEGAGFVPRDPKHPLVSWPMSVSIADTPCRVLDANTSHVSCLAGKRPVFASHAGPILVSGAFASATCTTCGHFVYSALHTPTITGVAPSETTVGLRVTVTGTGFTAVVDRYFPPQVVSSRPTTPDVLFGGAPTSDVVVVSDTALNVLVPPIATFYGPIAVFWEGIGFAWYLDDASYTSSGRNVVDVRPSIIRLRPSTVSANGGDIVLIVGDGFADDGDALAITAARGRQDQVSGSSGAAPAGAIDATARKNALRGSSDAATRRLISVTVCGAPCRILTTSSRNLTCIAPGLVTPLKLATLTHHVWSSALDDLYLDVAVRNTAALFAPHPTRQLIQQLRSAQGASDALKPNIGGGTSNQSSGASPTSRWSNSSATVPFTALFLPAQARDSLQRSRYRRPDESAAGEGLLQAGDDGHAEVVSNGGQCGSGVAAALDEASSRPMLNRFRVDAATQWIDLLPMRHARVHVAELRFVPRLLSAVPDGFSLRWSLIGCAASAGCQTAVPLSVLASPHLDSSATHSRMPPFRRHYRLFPAPGWEVVAANESLATVAYDDAAAGSRPVAVAFPPFALGTSAASASLRISPALQTAEAAAAADTQVTTVAPGSTGAATTSVVTAVKDRSRSAVTGTMVSSSSRFTLGGRSASFYGRLVVYFELVAQRRGGGRPSVNRSGGKPAGNVILQIDGLRLLGVVGNTTLPASCPVNVLCFNPLNSLRSMQLPTATDRVVSTQHAVPFVLPRPSAAPFRYETCELGDTSSTCVSVSIRRPPPSPASALTTETGVISSISLDRQSTFNAWSQDIRTPVAARGRSSGYPRFPATYTLTGTGLSPAPGVSFAVSLFDRSCSQSSAVSGDGTAFSCTVSSPLPRLSSQAGTFATPNESFAMLPAMPAVAFRHGVSVRIVDASVLPATAVNAGALVPLEPSGSDALAVGTTMRPAKFWSSLATWTAVESRASPCDPRVPRRPASWHYSFPSVATQLIRDEADDDWNRRPTMEVGEAFAAFGNERQPTKNRRPFLWDAPLVHIPAGEHVVLDVSPPGVLFALVVEGTLSVAPHVAVTLRTTFLCVTDQGAFVVGDQREPRRLRFILDLVPAPALVPRAAARHPLFVTFASRFAWLPPDNRASVTASMPSRTIAQFIVAGGQVSFVGDVAVASAAGFGFLYQSIPAAGSTEISVESETTDRTPGAWLPGDQVRVCRRPPELDGAGDADDAFADVFVCEERLIYSTRATHDGATNRRIVQLASPLAGAYPTVGQVTDLARLGALPDGVSFADPSGTRRATLEQADQVGRRWTGGGAFVVWMYRPITVCSGCTEAATMLRSLSPNTTSFVPPVRQAAWSVPPRQGAFDPLVRFRLQQERFEPFVRVLSPTAAGSTRHDATQIVFFQGVMFAPAAGASSSAATGASLSREQKGTPSARRRLAGAVLDIDGVAGAVVAACLFADVTQSRTSSLRVRGGATLTDVRFNVFLNPRSHAISVVPHDDCPGGANTWPCSPLPTARHTHIVANLVVFGTLNLRSAMVAAGLPAGTPLTMARVPLRDLVAAAADDSCGIFIDDPFWLTSRRHGGGMIAFNTVLNAPRAGLAVREPSGDTLWRLLAERTAAVAPDEPPEASAIVTDCVVVGGKVGIDVMAGGRRNTASSLTSTAWDSPPSRQDVYETRQILRGGSFGRMLLLYQSDAALSLAAGDTGSGACFEHGAVLWRLHHSLASLQARAPPTTTTTLAAAVTSVGSGRQLVMDQVLTMIVLRQDSNRRGASGPDLGAATNLSEVTAGTHLRCHGACNITVVRPIFALVLLDTRLPHRGTSAIAASLGLRIDVVAVDSSVLFRPLPAWLGSISSTSATIDVPTMDSTGSFVLPSHGFNATEHARIGLALIAFTDNCLATPPPWRLQSATVDIRPTWNLSDTNLLMSSPSSGSRMNDTVMPTNASAVWFAELTARPGLLPVQGRRSGVDREQACQRLALLQLHPLTLAALPTSAAVAATPPPPMNATAEVGLPMSFLVMVAQREADVPYVPPPARQPTSGAVGSPRWQLTCRAIAAMIPPRMSACVLFWSFVVNISSSHDDGGSGGTTDLSRKRLATFLVEHPFLLKRNLTDDGQVVALPMLVVSRGAVRRGGPSDDAPFTGCRCENASDLSVNVIHAPRLSVSQRLSAAMGQTSARLASTVAKIEAAAGDSLPPAMCDPSSATGPADADRQYYGFPPLWRRVGSNSSSPVEGGASMLEWFPDYLSLSIQTWVPLTAEPKEDTGAGNPSRGVQRGGAWTSARWVLLPVSKAVRVSADASVGVDAADAVSAVDAALVGRLQHGWSSAGGAGLPSDDDSTLMTFYHGRSGWLFLDPSPLLQAASGTAVPTTTAFDALSVDAWSPFNHASDAANGESMPSRRLFPVTLRWHVPLPAQPLNGLSMHLHRDSLRRVLWLPALFDRRTTVWHPVAELETDAATAVLAGGHTVVLTGQTEEEEEVLLACGSSACTDRLSRLRSRGGLACPVEPNASRCLIAASNETEVIFSTQSRLGFRVPHEPLRPHAACVPLLASDQAIYPTVAATFLRADTATVAPTTDPSRAGGNSSAANASSTSAPTATGVGDTSAPLSLTPATASGSNAIPSRLYGTLHALYWSTQPPWSPSSSPEWVPSAPLAASPVLLAWSALRPLTVACRQSGGEGGSEGTPDEEDDLVIPEDVTVTLYTPLPARVAAPTTAAFLAVNATAQTFRFRRVVVAGTLHIARACIPMLATTLWDNATSDWVDNRCKFANTTSAACDGTVMSSTAIVPPQLRIIVSGSILVLDGGRIVIAPFDVPLSANASASLPRSTAPLRYCGDVDIIVGGDEVRSLNGAADMAANVITVNTTAEVLRRRAVARATSSVRLDRFVLAATVEHLEWMDGSSNAEWSANATVPANSVWHLVLRETLLLAPPSAALRCRLRSLSVDVLLRPGTVALFGGAFGALGVTPSTRLVPYNSQGLKGTGNDGRVLPLWFLPAEGTASSSAASSFLPIAFSTFSYVSHFSPAAATAGLKRSLSRIRRGDLASAAATSSRNRTHTWLSVNPLSNGTLPPLLEGIPGAHIFDAQPWQRAVGATVVVASYAGGIEHHRVATVGTEALADPTGLPTTVSEWRLAAPLAADHAAPSLSAAVLSKAQVVTGGRVILGDAQGTALATSAWTGNGGVLARTDRPITITAAHLLASVDAAALVARALEAARPLLRLLRLLPAVSDDHPSTSAKPRAHHLEGLGDATMRFAGMELCGAIFALEVRWRFSAVPVTFALDSLGWPLPPEGLNSSVSRTVHALLHAYDAVGNQSDDVRPYLAWAATTAVAISGSTAASRVDVNLPALLTETGPVSDLLSWWQFGTVRATGLDGSPALLVPAVALVGCVIERPASAAARPSGLLDVSFRGRTSWVTLLDNVAIHAKLTLDTASRTSLHTVSGNTFFAAALTTAIPAFPFSLLDGAVSGSTGNQTFLAAAEAAAAAATSISRLAMEDTAAPPATPQRTGLDGTLALIATRVFPRNPWRSFSGNKFFLAGELNEEAGRLSHYRTAVAPDLDDFFPVSLGAIISNNQTKLTEQPDAALPLVGIALVTVPLVSNGGSTFKIRVAATRNGVMVSNDSLSVSVEIDVMAAANSTTSAPPRPGQVHWSTSWRATWPRCAWSLGHEASQSPDVIATCRQSAVWSVALDVQFIAATEGTTARQVLLQPVDASVTDGYRASIPVSLTPPSGHFVAMDAPFRYAPAEGGGDLAPPSSASLLTPADVQQTAVALANLVSANEASVTISGGARPNASWTALKPPAVSYSVDSHRESDQESADARDEEALPTLDSRVPAQPPAEEGRDMGPWIQYSVSEAWAILGSGMSVASMPHSAVGGFTDGYYRGLHLLGGIVVIEPSTVGVAMASSANDWLTARRRGIANTSPSPPSRSFAGIPDALSVERVAVVQPSSLITDDSSNASSSIASSLSPLAAASATTTRVAIAIHVDDSERTPRRRLAVLLRGVELSSINMDGHFSACVALMYSAAASPTGMRRDATVKTATVRLDNVSFPKFSTTAGGGGAVVRGPSPLPPFVTLIAAPTGDVLATSDAWPEESLMLVDRAALVSAVMSRSAVETPYADSRVAMLLPLHTLLHIALPALAPSLSTLSCRRFVDVGVATSVATGGSGTVGTDTNAVVRQPFSNSLSPLDATLQFCQPTKLDPVDEAAVLGQTVPTIPAFNAVGRLRVTVVQRGNETVADPLSDAEILETVWSAAGDAVRRLAIRPLIASPVASPLDSDWQQFDLHAVVRLPGPSSVAVEAPPDNAHRASQGLKLSSPTDDPQDEAAAPQMPALRYNVPAAKIAASPREALSVLRSSSLSRALVVDTRKTLRYFSVGLDECLAAKADVSAGNDSAATVWSSTTNGGLLVTFPRHEPMMALAIYRSASCAAKGVWSAIDSDDAPTLRTRRDDATVLLWPPIDIQQWSSTGSNGQPRRPDLVASVVLPCGCTASVQVLPVAALVFTATAPSDSLNVAVRSMKPSLADALQLPRNISLVVASVGPATASAAPEKELAFDASRGSTFRRAPSSDDGVQFPTATSSTLRLWLIVNPYAQQRPDESRRATERPLPTEDAVLSSTVRDAAAAVAAFFGLPIASDGSVQSRKAQLDVADASQDTTSVTKEILPGLVLRLESVWMPATGVNASGRAVYTASASSGLLSAITIPLKAYDAAFAAVAVVLAVAIAVAGSKAYRYLRRRRQQQMEAEKLRDWMYSRRAGEVDGAAHEEEGLIALPAAAVEEAADSALPTAGISSEEDAEAARVASQAAMALIEAQAMTLHLRSLPASHDYLAAADIALASNDGATPQSPRDDTGGASNIFFPAGWNVSAGASSRSDPQQARWIVGTDQHGHATRRQRLVTWVPGRGLDADDRPVDRPVDVGLRIEHSDPRTSQAIRDYLSVQALCLSEGLKADSLLFRLAEELSLRHVGLEVDECTMHDRVPPSALQRSHSSSSSLLFSSDDQHGRSLSRSGGAGSSAFLTATMAGEAENRNRKKFAFRKLAATNR